MGNMAKMSEDQINNQSFAKKQLIQYALEIEEQVMKQCTLSKDSINDASIAPYVEKLKEYNVIQKGINNDIEER